MTLIDNFFYPLYELPCWQVQLGYLSKIIFNFGNPTLFICEPKSKIKSQIPAVRDIFSKRSIMVHGSWWLWIYSCHWRIFSNGSLLAEKDDHSIRRKKYAVKKLDGQILTNVAIDLNSNVTTFDFDLGGRLEAMPYDDLEEEPDELWTLVEPSRNTFTVRSDGTFGYAAKDSDSDKHRWRSLRTLMSLSPTTDGEAA